jgi:hypothetical protein
MTSSRVPLGKARDFKEIGEDSYRGGAFPGLENGPARQARSRFSAGGPNAFEIPDSGSIDEIDSRFQRIVKS